MIVDLAWNLKSLKSRSKVKSLSSLASQSSNLNNSMIRLLMFPIALRTLHVCRKKNDYINRKSGLRSP